MHRLKKWFGIEDKDPNVPLTFSSKKPPDINVTPVSGDASANNSAFAAITNTKPDNVESQKNAAMDKRMLPEAMDAWFRRYVPLAPNECLECKLTQLGTIGLLLGILTVVLGTEAKKKIGYPKVYYNVQFGRLLLLTVGSGVLYQRWHNMATFAPLPENLTEEEKKEYMSVRQRQQYKSGLEKANIVLQKFKDFVSGKDL